MVEWITALVACQLAGEVTVGAFGLPIPGPVAGMGLLLAGLLWRGALPEGLSRTADALLANLSLLFVPAGAGIMLHFDLLRQNFLPLLTALILSTLAAIAVTAKIMEALLRDDSHD